MAARGRARRWSCCSPPPEQGHDWERRRASGSTSTRTSPHRPTGSPRRGCWRPPGGAARGAASRGGEMVVLLRSFGGVDTYERALADAGLEPYVVGGRGYWSQQQVEDVLAVLERDREPARRRGRARLPRVALLRRRPRHALAPPALARDRRRAGALVALLADAARGRPRGDPRRRRGPPLGARRSSPDELERLRELPRRDRAAARARPRCSGFEGTIEAACDRFGYDLATLMRDRGSAALGQRPQADAPGARVRGQRRRGPARLPRLRRGRDRCAPARARPRSRPRSTTASGS